MEHIYQYIWIISFLPLQVPLLIGAGLFFFPTATKNLRRIWAFSSILLLNIVMIFSMKLSIQQINKFGYLLDPLTSIMLILITTVANLLLVYSDNCMSHDQGYLRFFAYMSFFNTSMLGLVTSSNLIQFYILWELVGMCS
ncbi:NAD(P)H-quinone oxidoreductase subunit 5 chloroplastic [Bienertia sinuspersici]